MSTVISDKRELKVEVYLSAIGMTDIGVESGNYSVSSTNLDPQNLRPLNYYKNINNPIDTLLSGFGITEYKYSSKIKQISSVQNAKISEVYTSPSASSCTFAFGGILPDDPVKDASGVYAPPKSHPVFDLLRGPNSLEYKYFNLETPVVVSKIANLNPPETKDLLQNIPGIKPFVPFIKFNYGPANSRAVASRTYDEIFLSYQTSLSHRTSYNIWQLYDSNSGLALTNRVREYEGPIPTRDADGSSATNIKTIRDGLNGSNVFVDSLGKGRSAKVKRIFPSSKDALYYDTKQEIKNKFGNTVERIDVWTRNTQPANIFYPTKFRRQKKYVTGNALDTGYEDFGSHLVYDQIFAQGSDNCGFHIRLKNINAPDSDSSIVLLYEDQEPDLINKPNTISKFEIVLTPKSLPKLVIYNNNKSNFAKEYIQLNSPVFDSMDEFDVFVHFAGPVLLIGFESNQNNWNAIYADTIKDNTHDLDFLFKKEKSFVSMSVTNVSFQFNYSAIFFDNYSYNSNDKSLDSVKDIWFANKEKTYELPPVYRFRIKNGEPAFFAASESTTYDVLNTKNFALLNFKTKGDQVDTISENSLLSNLIKQKFLSFLYPGTFNQIPDKPISIFGDWRNVSIDNNSIDSIFKIVQIFSSQGTDLFQGQNIVQTWSKLLFNGTIEGPLFLGLTANPNKVFKDVEFLKPIADGDISNYVSSININCNAENANASFLKKIARITLSNLDSSFIGWRILELIEHNIIAITVKAYYVQEGNEPVFFQGVITDTSTTRTGSNSDLNLTCEDLSSYLLENTFFDTLVPFATLKLKDCVEAVMQSSGFGDYFKFASYENGETVDKYVQNLDLRLSPNPTTNQDILIGTIYDRIIEKLNIFLSKFVGIPTDTNKAGQATFRWEPGKGFIFDARYSPFAIDDLLFTGIDPVIDTVTSTPINTENSSDPGWHGLLSGGFTISTSTVPISSSVETFGFTVRDGYIARSSDNAFISQSLSTQSLNNIINSLVSTDSVPNGYVGFRKKILDQLERNELFSQEVLDFKHKQNEKIARIPYHSINFDCYVTRPLNFHGTFIIRQFLNDVNKTEFASTDQYIYKSIDYTIDKKTNLITASITGIRQPWTIRELDITYGQ